MLCCGNLSSTTCLRLFLQSRLLERYFVFLDDDMLAMVPQTGSWTKFEKFLLEELPAVGYITRTRHYHSLGRGRLPEGVGVTCRA